MKRTPRREDERRKKQFNCHVALFTVLRCHFTCYLELFVAFSSPTGIKKTRKCLAFHVQDFLPALSLLTTIYFNAFLLRRLFSQLSSFLFTPSNFSKYAAIFIYYPFFVCIWRGQRENSFIPFVTPKLVALDGG
jgi:hypothetical protein